MLFFSTFWFGCSSDKNEENKTIKIASNLPLTGSLATYGEAVRDGAEFALSNILKSKGTNGPNLIFDWQDNASQAKNAVSIFQKQKNDVYDIYISGVKPQTMAIIDEVSKIGKPHFVWIFDADVTQKYRNTFRTWVSYKAEPLYYMKYINKVKPSKIAIIYVKLPHTDFEFNKILIPKLKQSGINNLYVEPYLFAESNFKNIATKIKEFNPDLIMLNGFKGHLIKAIKAFREYNLIKDGNTICTYDLLDAAQDLSPQMLEGLRLVVPQFETRYNNNSLIKWKKNFQQKFNRQPRYTDAYAYDMTYIIFYASEKFEKGKYKDLSTAILNTDFNGITGQQKFDNTGDLILSLDIGYYQDGKLLFED